MTIISCGIPPFDSANTSRSESSATACERLALTFFKKGNGHFSISRQNSDNYDKRKGTLTSVVQSWKATCGSHMQVKSRCF